MRILFTIILLFGASLSSPPKAAADCAALAAPGKEGDFARVLFRSRLSFSARALALQSACKELDRHSHVGDFVQTIESPMDRLMDHLAIAHLGDLWTDWSSLGNSGTEVAFGAALSEIRKDPDPVARIQNTYELVAHFQGKEAGAGGGWLSSWLPSPPGTILKRAHDTGEGGVCLDFANLLYWSLSQVAHPLPQPGQANSSADSFSVTRKLGFGRWKGRKDGGHAWVRVSLVDPNSQAQYEIIDLDTDWYSGQFTPLMPRFRNDPNSNLNQELENCRRIEACMEGEGAQRNAVEYGAPGEEDSARETDAK